MTSDDEKARAAAVTRILVTLRNPLMLMSIPDRTAAIDLAQKYGITAVELLEAATAYVKRP